MSLTMLLNRPCLLIHRTESGSDDDYGTDVPDETSEATVCDLQPTQTSEPAQAGELGIATYDCFLPAGTILATGDAVVMNDGSSLAGQTLEVLGPVERYRNPRTQIELYVKATVRRAAGSSEVGS